LKIPAKALPVPSEFLAREVAKRKISFLDAGESGYQILMEEAAFGKSTICGVK